MSTWLELLNDIKRRCSAELLTPAQAAAHDHLCQIMSMPEWANLCGPHGSGKTFLAWTVARATGGVYVPVPAQLDELESNQRTLIVDNAPHRENDVRRLLSRCSLLDAKTVLLVTHSPALLPMLRVELPQPSPEDIDLVTRLIIRLGYFFEAERLPENPSFWDVLQASV
jgi:hypothetical protein